MSKDPQQSPGRTLARIHQEQSGCTPEQAETWLRGMEREQRYLANVFGG